MKLWGVTFDTGIIHGGNWYVDDVVVTGVASSPGPSTSVASVGVTPATLTLTTGQTQQLTATLRDAGGAVLTGRTITWTTSAPTVATVSSSGLVTAVASGTATITATSEGRSGTATVTISSTTPAPV